MNKPKSKCRGSWLARSVAIAVVALFCLSTTIIAGQKKQRVKASANIISSTISPKEACRKAFQQAESNALETVARELSSVKALVSSEDNGQVSEMFRKRISSRTTGRILEIDTLVNEASQVTLPDGTAGLMYHVEIEALVVVEDVDGRSPYDIKIRLEPRSRFEAGDQATVAIDVRETSYIHIFNITADNKVLILYPLKADDMMPVERGTTFIFPSDGSKLRLYPLPDHESDQEEIRVVATKNPMQFFASDLTMTVGNAGFIDLPVTDMITLEMEILRIPYDERGQQTVVYEVFKKKE